MAKIAILGAGISGLTTAYYLKKAGLDVTILEAKDSCGGVLQTRNKDGFQMELGPNTVLYNKPGIKQLIADLDLENELIFPGTKEKKRYILKKGNLIPLPSGISDFFSSKALSLSGKIRVLRERFIKANKDSEKESIADFAIRRFGKEAYHNFFLPFVSGSNAGDSAQLSVKHAFPNLYNLEQEYGSVIKGMISQSKKNKKKKGEKKGMFSFKKGLSRLTERLNEELAEELLFNVKVKSIEKNNEKYLIQAEQENKEFSQVFDYVISTIPAFALAEIIDSKHTYLKEVLDDVHYAPMCNVFLGYKKEDLEISPSGFGFLVPAFEKSSLLGALFSSQMFENTSPNNSELFTTMIGGSRFEGLTELKSEALIALSKSEMKKIFKAKNDPFFTFYHKYKKAIPQYDLKHGELIKVIARFEKEMPNFHVSGNFINGISVPNCIENSIKISERIAKQEN